MNSTSQGINKIVSLLNTAAGLTGSITRRAVCARCSAEFEFQYTTGVARRYCDTCQPVIRKEQKAEILRRYRQTPEGKAANVESSAKYRQSSKGKAVRAKIMRDYYHSPEGRIAMDKRWDAYYNSPGGKAAIAKMLARRRERSTSPESYAARVELLHTLHEPCANCGTPYKISHQIDHIVALCLGGNDDWDNLQPLCLECHRDKTGEDLHEFRERIGNTAGAEINDTANE